MGTINELADSHAGSVMLSILLGLGLAAMFRKVCKDKQCIVVKGPSTNETRDYYYKIQDDCFKYTPVVSECDNE